MWLESTQLAQILTVLSKAGTNGWKLVHFIFTKIWEFWSCTSVYICGFTEDLIDSIFLVILTYLCNPLWTQFENCHHGRALRALSTFGSVLKTIKWRISKLSNIDSFQIKTKILQFLRQKARYNCNTKLRTLNYKTSA